MELSFLDRQRQRQRLERVAASRPCALAVVFGRRRLGKSRLLRESLQPRRTVYYLGDTRESPLQLHSLAAEMAALVPGFDDVRYPEWANLLRHWWAEADDTLTLVLDEFPALVAVAPELPSLLQKHVDTRRGPNLILCGSSQRLMHGLVLDRTAALFGRSKEILDIGPLPAGWLSDALSLPSPSAYVEAYAVWGGVPRYWELAAEFEDTETAVRDMVLDPLGVLHSEPANLLLDDIRDPMQSLSLLEVIGSGCHRLSEIAGRMEKPATSLARPMQKLIDLHYVRRDYPYGTSARDSKRSLYRIADPFMRFWFQYVSRRRSQLAFGQLDRVAAEVRTTRSHYTAAAWEDLARASVPLLNLYDESWDVASAWWGPGLDGRPLEVDVVSLSADGKALLLGAVKWEDKTDVRRVLAELAVQAARLPLAQGRRVNHAVWVKQTKVARTDVVPCARVLGVLR